MQKTFCCLVLVVLGVSGCQHHQALSGCNETSASWSEQLRSDDLAALQCTYPRGLEDTLRDPRGDSPLLVAADANAEHALAWLLQTGSQADRAVNGEAALHRAVSRGHCGLLPTLIKGGANPDLKRPDGANPLLIAIWKKHPQCSDQLLAAGADPNVSLPNSATALLFAVRQRSPQIVDQIIAAGGDVHRANDVGVTPLMAAASLGDVGVLGRLLAEGTTVSARNNKGWAATHYAAVSCQPNALRILLDEGGLAMPETGVFAELALAAGVGCIDAAQLLLGAGMPIDIATPSGMTPLMIAAQNGQDEMVSWLIALGSNTQTRDVSGRDYLAWREVAVHQ